MSEEQGLVSLWIGTAESADALEEYMTFQYTEDGDAIPPPFGDDFDIEWFDEDFREAEVIDPASRSLRELLSGFSYEDVIVPRFVELCGETLDVEANAVVLLYNFNYDGRIPATSTGAVRLKFLGVVPYE